MSTLYLPIGMIGSGKSTWARENGGSGIKIVSGDNLRYMLYGGEYTYNQDFEPTVIRLLLEMSQSLIRSGFDVILDECYCSLTREQRLRVIDHCGTHRIVAVTFPERDMQDRIEDKVMKGLRGKTVAYWKNVFKEMSEIYEPFDKSEQFDSVIEVR